MRLLDILKRFFEGPTPPDYLRTGVTHDYTKSCWGHTLHGPAGTWTLSGHGPLFGPTIKEGDWIRARLQSGRIGRLLVIRVQYCRDPEDMWMANYVNDGYEEEKT